MTRNGAKAPGNGGVLGGAAYAHCGLADGGKARRLGMTLCHEQPVAG